MNAEIDKIIELLGGCTKVAELCEITPSAVTQWRTNGIPKAQLKFLRLARPDVFNELTQKKNRKPQSAGRVKS